MSLNTIICNQFKSISLALFSILLQIMQKLLCITDDN